jgi:flagellar protein FliS
MDGSIQDFSSLAAYRVVEGIGAEPEQFIKIAMDAARVFLLQAEKRIAVGDRIGKARALSSAGRIIEFMLGLSGTEHGVLSDRLAQVYEFILQAILRGNMANDLEALAAGRLAVEDLSAVWRKRFPDALVSGG